MNTQAFVDALRRVVMTDTVDGLLRVLVDPPGREPATAVREVSEWYRRLAPNDRAMLERVMRMTAHDTVFGVLCVLDGVRQVEDAGGKGTFILLFAKHDTLTNVIGPDTPLAHELLGSFHHQPESK